MQTKPLKPLARFLHKSLAPLFILTVVTLLASKLVGSEGGDIPPWVAYTGLSVTFLYLVMVLVVGIAFLRWVYVVSHNLKVRSKIKPKAGPFLSVILFFIPIINLFMSYLVLANLQKVVSKQQDSHKWELNRIYGWGFLFHFLSSLAGRIDLSSGEANPLLTALFLYSYESEVMQNLQKYGAIKQCVSFS